MTGVHGGADDEDLIEQLIAVARWLDNDAAHQPDRHDYRRVAGYAAVCRVAATRIDQLLLMLKANGGQVEQSGVGQQPRLTLAEDDEE